MDSCSKQFWEERYQASQTPWDLKGPTPVFRKLLEEAVIPPGKLLVPGAGRGYDAIAFARAGFDVTSVDLAPSACEVLRQSVEASGVKVEVREADFFELQEDSAYDAVLEYTFYCAIPIASRTHYRDQMARILKPGGLLFGLFFPLEATDSEGPPFGVEVESVKASFSEIFDLVHESFPPESIKPRAGREILMIWRKRRAST